ncbi:hypothetical protein RI056_02970 [Komagataeibacter nataicola]|uniref:hypothetical protein n=1 Tax=Komagataeibacter nataicola TaxID=265960 RepID=UPI0028A9E7C3|nr:hypothetical protein [Komagataeibacter nataicola]WNM09045.1 hypothetical protein RI056_02970 [Komagataeibacter nataicola]
MADAVQARVRIAPSMHEGCMACHGGHWPCCCAGEAGHRAAHWRLTGLNGGGRGGVPANRDGQWSHLCHAARGLVAPSHKDDGRRIRGAVASGEQALPATRKKA